MNDVREQLIRDHGELEQLLQRLADDSAAPEPAALLPTWCQFETRLLAHMDAEERYLLPLLDVSHARESAQTRAEHARIRELVSELGVAVELHTARQAAITELIAILRQHSEHEEESVYPLGSQRAEAHVQTKISAALETARRLASTLSTRVAAVIRSSSNDRARP